MQIQMLGDSKILIYTLFRDFFIRSAESRHVRHMKTIELSFLDRNELFKKFRRFANHINSIKQKERTEDRLNSATQNIHFWFFLLVIY